ncbi:hypothetical protein SUGI_0974010 [Cryptomeria japonica]|uniref:uncharacterized protein LOC131073848 n=1 Tax=Cryptomeria japonica TaxID=3369 RepID=UPI002414C938|nr:uncharacterized protein LOC131073848 [Cryptomeria japonica]GLJ46234.1 hypothetical protein SUGI_0974010 [Cryptomeria japonica]
MAWRATACWNGILSKYQKTRQISSYTQFRMQPHHGSSSSASHGGVAASGPLRYLKPDFLPIYTILGMTLMAVFLGSLTMKQQLLHSPNVSVDKKKRKSMPEVKDPEFALQKSEDFRNKSFFRRVSHTTQLSKSMP